MKLLFVYSLQFNSRISPYIVLIIILLLGTSYGQTLTEQDSSVLLSKSKASFKNKFNLIVRLKPHIYLDPGGSLIGISDEGSFTQEMASAKVAIKIKPKKSQPFGLDFGYDFVKPKLLNAFIYMKANKYIELKSGRLKVPFGLDFQRSSNDIAVHERSKSTSIIKDNISSSRHNGLQFQSKTPWDQKLSLSFFNSPNIVKLPGLEIIQMTNIEFIQEFSYASLGASWLSDAIKLFEDEYYRSNNLSLWASFTPSHWRIEFEYIKFDPEVALYIKTLGSVDEQSISSNRTLLEYTFKINDDYVVAPLTQYERIEKQTGNVNYIRNGVWLKFLNHNKTPKVSLSLNNLMKYNEFKERLDWDEVGLQLLYLISTKGKI